MRKLLILPIFALALALTATPAFAFSCPNEHGAAQAAIDEATAAVNGMPDGEAKGLVHTLIDDAKALLASSQHNHAKPAAGKYDHARSVAKARSAVAFAEAALILADKS